MIVSLNGLVIGARGFPPLSSCQHSAWWYLARSNIEYAFFVVPSCVSLFMLLNFLRWLSPINSSLSKIIVETNIIRIYFCFHLLLRVRLGFFTRFMISQSWSSLRTWQCSHDPSFCSILGKCKSFIWFNPISNWCTIVSPPINSSTCRWLDSNKLA